MLLIKIKVSLLLNKYYENHPVPRFFFNRQQVNNAIINNVVGEILLNETQKLSAVRKAPEFLDSDYDENNLYQVEEISLE